MAITDTELGSSPAALGDGTFLATKFYAPRPRPATIERPALVARLEESSAARLTVLAAPAGCGKTTLLGEWLASPGRRRSAWLSIEPADNDPVRFWAAVVHALRTVEPAFGAGALAALSASAGLLDVVLPAVVNELAALPQPVVLVLDDYHVVESRAIHESVDFLLDQGPDPLHLVIASRTDPPLALGRLRGRGEMAELRIGDLRFDERETDSLLNGALGIGLEPSDVRGLQEHTEGWAAGIYLAGLSLRGRDDAREAARAFTGDDRHVVDYLAAEVLDRLPDAVREFLLRTSILGRMCGALCDAVRGASDSAEVLRDMERWNLFLVPLDRRREWYRYHQLFADLLRYELQLVHPDEVPQLHRRAAAWSSENGAAPEAIHHALQGGDAVMAAELVAAHWNQTLQSGQVRTVERWLADLPADLVAGDPRLCIARAWTFVFAGQLEQVELWTARAEAGRHPGPFPIGSSLQSAAAALRAAYSHLAGDTGAMLSAARRAESLERRDGPARCIALLLLGYALGRSGEPQEAVAALEGALVQAEAAGPTAVMTAFSLLAAIELDEGRVDEARGLCEDALRLVQRHGFGERWMTAWPLIVEGRLSECDGRLADAEAGLERALVLARRGGARLEALEASARLAWVRRSRRDRHGAERAIHDAQRLLAACPDPGALAGLVGEAVAGRRPAPPVRPGDELSERELAVLRLLAGSLSNRDIGSELFISLNTVKTHVRRIYQKLGAADRREAVRRARELGLLQRSPG